MALARRQGGMTPAGAARVGPQAAADDPPGAPPEPAAAPLAAPAGGDARLAPAASLASLHLTRRRGTPPARAKAGDLSLAPAGSVRPADQAAAAEVPAVPAREEIREEARAAAGGAPAPTEAPVLETPPPGADAAADAADAADAAV